MTPRSRADPPSLVNAAVPRQFPAALREIRIVQALRRAARCGRCALRQRSKAAVDIAAADGVGLRRHNRVAWIIGLGARRARRPAPLRSSESCKPMRALGAPSEACKQHHVEISCLSTALQAPDWSRRLAALKGMRRRWQQQFVSCGIAVPKAGNPPGLAQRRAF